MEKNNQTDTKSKDRKIIIGVFVFLICAFILAVIGSAYARNITPVSTSNSYKSTSDTDEYTDSSSSSSSYKSSYDSDDHTDSSSSSSSYKSSYDSDDHTDSSSSSSSYKSSSDSSNIGEGGYEMPNSSDKSFSDYVKRVDPELYQDMQDRWDSLDN